MVQKKILIIQGHPDQESFGFALAESYKKGAENAGHSVEEIRLRDLKFNPILEYGYRKRTELEPDLLDSQKKILWADHIVWIYPVWWGSVPALLKGFLDRVLIPGFAFKRREGSVWWDKFLTGRSSRIISTMDQPAWYFWLVYGEPSNRMMKRTVLEFCGIKPVQVTSIGPIRMSKEKFRENWLEKVGAFGKKGI
ncbi:NAD(P)H-dependent oxidoreductase [Leptospira ilyithenensis]|uniref:Flavodoxin family protein n=1 Tax=Leptospira ilyithenensis TaxID=2484901 RepID=A0A4R9LTY5_9LEPT|nr:NAD(P)H-dependent oxidoreductase [Leptospira ilyithenensis]TGN13371.1 flavodoxin family protein [Leptospira ilyithenensis]